MEFAQFVREPRISEIARRIVFGKSLGNPSVTLLSIQCHERLISQEPVVRSTSDVSYPPYVCYFGGRIDVEARRKSAVMIYVWSKRMLSAFNKSTDRQYRITKMGIEARKNVVWSKVPVGCSHNS